METTLTFALPLILTLATSDTPMVEMVDAHPSSSPRLSPSSSSPPHTKRRLRYGVGLGVVQLADYAGSGTRKVYALPFPYIEYQGEHLTIKDEKANWSWPLQLWHRGLSTYHLELSVSGFLTPPVDSEPDNRRHGMPDVSPILEIGPSLLFRSSPNPTHYAGTPNESSHSNQIHWGVELALRAALAINMSDSSEASEERFIEHQGWVFNPKITIGQQRSEWTFAGLISNERYLDYLYGVPDQFTTAIRQGYRPSGGINGYYISTKYTIPLATFSEQLDRSFSLYFYGRLQFLGGTGISDSPLVEQDQNLTTGFTLIWVYGEG